MHRKIVSAIVAFTVAGSSCFCLPLHAEESSGLKDTVDHLNGSVQEKRQRVKELDTLISAYKQRIAQQEKQEVTFANEIVLLENRIREKELDIQRSKAEIEALTLEIAELQEDITRQEAKIAGQKDLIAELIRRTHQADAVSVMDVFLTKPSLSSFFDRLEELKRVERDLGGALDKVKGTRELLAHTKQLRDERRTGLISEQRNMKKEEIKLEEQRNVKISLVSETQERQEEFERVLYELRQQQQSTSDDISRLEEKLKTTLDEVDRSLARGDVLLNWPVTASKGVSAHFHDPDYPFRRYFEHPGTDIPIPVGTPVKAAAGGYIAWNKTGKAYGNYTMIVHPGGIATVYAHLSKFIGKPDTYVERGEIIGLSGGRPGDPGAGLSTGAHLHFEVRQNGIPVDAENFLPHLAGDQD